MAIQRIRKQEDTGKTPESLIGLVVRDKSWPNLNCNRDGSPMPNNRSHMVIGQMIDSQTNTGYCVLAPIGIHRIPVEELRSSSYGAHPGYTSPAQRQHDRAYFRPEVAIKDVFSDPKVQERYNGHEATIMMDSLMVMPTDKVLTAYTTYGKANEKALSAADLFQSGYAFSHAYDPYRCLPRNGMPAEMQRVGAVMTRDPVPVSEAQFA